VQRIAIVLFEGAQLLDAAGPGDVFTLANEFIEQRRYELIYLSSAGGLVAMSNGLPVQTRSVRSVGRASIDTLIIAGGTRDGLIAAVQDTRLRAWVTRAASRARRLASVCTGAFALAHWGLLDNRLATTHWASTDLLQRHYRSVAVQADALYVVDQHVWTSGGVSAGIDMCLSMVELDHSRWLAARVAKQLVLTSRRVGNQAQYSVELQGQAGAYAELVEWMRRHLKERLDIRALAARARQSERTFCRRFRQETAVTPAAFVEALRLRVAREKLERGMTSKEAAVAAGFTSDEHLARVFRRKFDMSPMEYRRVHGMPGGRD
jgi:transcriptional regulator GlxA family with amidase domain